MLNTGLATPAPSAPSAPAVTALAAVGRRWRRRLSRMVLVLLGICLSIAALLLAIDGGSFRVKLTYSLCIGLCCTLMYDLAWFAQAWAYDRLRSLRRLPPSAGPYLCGWAGTLPAAALCVLLGPMLGQTLADTIFGFSSPSVFNLDSSASRFTVLVSGLATFVLILILSTAERLASARAQAEAAQRQATETQLRLLQSQLEPHMLFNTLANLRVLISLEPVRALAMLDHLIAFLRATLAASRQGEHPLTEEFARLSDYLAVMAVRMGPRLAVQLDMPPELKDLPVPPLLLQPLVENSIQHGLEPQVEGGQVTVRARREADTLVLEVLDSGIGRSAAAGVAASMPGRPAGGFGLAGIRERLATLYGERASLSLQDAPGGSGTLATVRLPILPVTVPVPVPMTMPLTVTVTATVPMPVPEPMPALVPVPSAAPSTASTAAKASATPAST